VAAFWNSNAANQPANTPPAHIYVNCKTHDHNDKQGCHKLFFERWLVSEILVLEMHVIHYIANVRWCNPSGQHGYPAHSGQK